MGTSIIYNLQNESWVHLLYFAYQLQTSYSYNCHIKSVMTLEIPLICFMSSQCPEVLPCTTTPSSPRDVVLTGMALQTTKPLVTQPWLALENIKNKQNYLLGNILLIPQPPPSRCFQISLCSPTFISFQRRMPYLKSFLAIPTSHENAPVLSAPEIRNGETISLWKWGWLMKEMYYPSPGNF